MSVSNIFGWHIMKSITQSYRVHLSCLFVQDYLADSTHTHAHTPCPPDGSLVKKDHSHRGQRSNRRTTSGLYASSRLLVFYFFLLSVRNPRRFGSSDLPSPVDNGSVCDRNEGEDVATPPAVRFSLLIQALASSSSLHWKR